MKGASCDASTTCAKTVRVDVAARVAVHQAPVADTKAPRVVARRVAQVREAMKPAFRAAPMVAVATISHLRRTAMIAQRADPAAVIVVVRAAPTVTSRAHIRRARTAQAQRDTQAPASPMDKAVHLVRAAALHTLATPQSFAAGTYLRAWTPARARRVRAATPMDHARTKAVPAPVARANPAVRVVPVASVGTMHRVIPVSMRVPASCAHPLRIPKAIVRVARIPARVATARKAHVPAAVVQASRRAAPAARRRTPARTVHARIAPTRHAVRAARVTKVCRATKTDRFPAMTCQ